MASMSFFIIFIPILSLILLAVNLALAPHNPYQEKNSVFECGFHSFTGQNRTQFSISFFIFALLFLLFDLEILLVYPYTVSNYINDIYGLIVMCVFFVLLGLGFVFELGKKALNISSKQTTLAIDFSLVNSPPKAIRYTDKQLSSGVPNNIIKVLITFCIGLVMKNFIMYFFSIDVVKDPNNYISLIFLGLMSCLSVYYEFWGNSIHKVISSFYLCINSWFTDNNTHKILAGNANDEILNRSCKTIKNNGYKPGGDIGKNNLAKNSVSGDTNKSVNSNNEEQGNISGDNGKRSILPLSEGNINPSNNFNNIPSDNNKTEHTNPAVPRLGAKYPEDCTEAYDAVTPGPSEYTEHSYFIPEVEKNRKAVIEARKRYNRVADWEGSEVSSGLENQLTTQIDEARDKLRYTINKHSTTNFEVKSYTDNSENLPIQAQADLEQTSEQKVDSWKVNSEGPDAPVDRPATPPLDTYLPSALLSSPSSLSEDNSPRLGNESSSPNINREGLPQGDLPAGEVLPKRPRDEYSDSEEGGISSNKKPKM